MRLATARSPSDQRRYRRRTVLWPALASTGRARLDCSVLNLSAGGARLRFQESDPPEGTIQIQIEGVGQLPARVVWRHERYVGVQFALPPESVHAVIDAPLDQGRVH